MPARSSGGRGAAADHPTKARVQRRPAARRPPAPAARRPPAAERSRRARRPAPAPTRRLPRPPLRFLRRALRPLLLLVATGAVCAGAYAAALETSMFALSRLVIVGGTPAVDAEVRAALAPEQGRSLLRVSGAEVDAAAAALPGVVSLRFTRSFPHTLHVYVTPERPVLLVREGKLGYVVSARGRVMAATADPAASVLPRLWMPKGTPLAVGETLVRSDGLLATAAAAALRGRRLPGGVRSISDAGGEVTVLTGSGFQLRLGDVGDLGLKLTIAQRIIAYAGPGLSNDAYVDVSVPERPVLGSNNSQVEGTG